VLDKKCIQKPNDHGSRSGPDLAEHKVHGSGPHPDPAGSRLLGSSLDPDSTESEYSGLGDPTLMTRMHAKAVPSSCALWTTTSVLPLNMTEDDSWPTASPVPLVDSAIPGKLVPLETDMRTTYYQSVLSHIIAHYENQL